MRRFMNSLTLQALLLVLSLICLADGAPYSKYGRTCKDIGCLPREVCVMAYESCSFNQQENVSCGRYPTCKKNTEGQSTQQNSGPSYPTPSSNSNTNIWNLPAATTTTTTRRTTTTTTTRRPWTTQAPFYNPSKPSYNGGGDYYGNRYGDDSTFGGYNTRTTTKRPSSSSSGSGSGFFSGLQGILAGEVGKFIGSAISNRGGGGGGSSGGFGSFFDTRPLTENKNYRGGLFNENTRTTSTGNHNYNAYPVTRYGDASPSTASPTASHGNFGWKLS